MLLPRNGDRDRWQATHSPVVTVLTVALGVASEAVRDQVTRQISSQDSSAEPMSMES